MIQFNILNNSRTRLERDLVATTDRVMTNASQNLKMKNLKIFLKFAKIVQTIFLPLEFFKVTHLQDLKKFLRPVKIVKLRKRKKNLKNRKRIASFHKLLQIFEIFIPSKSFHCLQILYSIPTLSLKYFE